MNVIDVLMEESRRQGLGSMSKVEKAVPLPRGRISKWTRGEGQPGWDDIVQWADRLGLSLDVLAGRLTREEWALLQTIRRLTPPVALARMELRPEPEREPQRHVAPARVKDAPTVAEQDEAKPPRNHRHRNNHSA